MNRGHVAVAVSMIVIGVAGLVAGVVAVFSGEVALVGLAALGALVVVLGVALLRDAVRAARVTGHGRRQRPDTDGGGYHPTPPTGDAGSGHVGRQRDRDDDGSGGPGGSEPVGGDSGGGWSGSGWSGGDSGGGWSGGGGDSGGGGGS